MRVLLLGTGVAVQLIYGGALLFVGFDEARLSRRLDQLFVYVAVIAAITWLGYIVDVTRNDSVTKEKRGLWIAVLILGTFFAEVAYFFAHVLPRRATEVAPEK